LLAVAFRKQGRHNSLISAMQVFDQPWLLTGSSFTSYGGRRNVGDGPAIG
jgi:hypothetical protein